MTDLQLLYLVLLLIYMSDSLFWVRRASVIFRAWFRYPPRATHPSTGLGSPAAGIVPLNPLPALGAAFVCTQWPLSLTPHAACAFVSTVPHAHDRPLQSAALISFDAINTVTRDGKTIRINDRPFLTLDSEAAAIHWSRLLLRLAPLPPETRDTLIDRALARSLDTAAIRRRHHRFLQQAAPFRIQALLLALFLFAGVPVTIANLDYRRFLLPALTALAGLLLINAVAFFFAHRRLYPAAVAHRLRTLSTLILTPPAAIRARDLLSRDLFANFHPLAVAALLCSPQELERLARTTLRDLTHPMQPAAPPDNPAAQEIIEQFHTRYTQTLRNFLVAQHLHPDNLLRPPPPADPACRTFCPRCEQQFLLPHGLCDSCGGIPLHPL